MITPIKSTITDVTKWLIRKGSPFNNPPKIRPKSPIFFPMHFVGMAGLPRRYYTNTAFPYFDDLADINVLITVFALITGLAQLIFLYNFIHSMYFGKKAEKNPWKSNTLEWTAPVEHIHGNWPGKIPEVHRWAYDYSKPGKKEDFVPQSTPISKGEKITEH